LSGGESEVVVHVPASDAVVCDCGSRLRSVRGDRVCSTTQDSDGKRREDSHSVERANQLEVVNAFRA